MRSKLYKIELVDFFNGLVTSVFSAVVFFVYDSLQMGAIVLEWQKIGITALSAALGYIIRKYLTNSRGELLTKETRP
jgi:hypothetical protein